MKKGIIFGTGIGVGILISVVANYIIDLKGKNDEKDEKIAELENKLNVTKDEN